MSAKFKIIIKKINDTSEAIKGKNVYYRCKKCQGVIPSIPKESVGCKCRNIFIDTDYFRLAIMDYNNFEIVEKS